ncbi:hypothetical protein D6D01_08364 [Aureobasidium pullulans]|uniref:C2H2-type domain-containing protein n=1 Tax=Aureobasidium pullulans TaxID=5580 RepID=A0A4S9KEB1_AURPU|nr:hypothetical protein D6D01_08364 [Aureobasidium pullulans]
MSLGYILAPSSPAHIKEKLENDTAAAAIPLKREPGTDDEIKQVKNDAENEEHKIALKQENKPVEELARTASRPCANMSDQDRMSWTCEWCEFTYSDIRELYAHCYVHLGYETTRCVACNVRSSDNAAAKKHATGGKHTNKLRALGVQQYTRLLHGHRGIQRLSTSDNEEGKGWLLAFHD